VFARDATVFVGDHAAPTTSARPERRRESLLSAAILRWHPRFLGTPLLCRPPTEPLEGGDVLLLGPGVAAIGVGGGHYAAGAERLGRELLATGLAGTVLFVPLSADRPGTRLDALVTPVDVDTVLLSAPYGDTLVAYGYSGGEDGEPMLRAPRPLRTVAAEALGGTELRVVTTGLEARPTPGHHWEHGTNALALAPGLCVAYERTTDTNAALRQAGVEVLTVPGAELVSPRGGPRALCCPLDRDPLP
jgi:arginine deiminase